MAALILIDCAVGRSTMYLAFCYSSKGFVKNHEIGPLPSLLDALKASKEGELSEDNQFFLRFGTLLREALDKSKELAPEVPVLAVVVGLTSFWRGMTYRERLQALDRVLLPLRTLVAKVTPVRCVFEPLSEKGEAKLARRAVEYAVLHSDLSCKSVDVVVSGGNSNVEFTPPDAFAAAPVTVGLSILKGQAVLREQGVDTWQTECLVQVDRSAGLYCSELAALSPPPSEIQAVAIGSVYWGGKSAGLVGSHSLDAVLAALTHYLRVSLAELDSLRAWDEDRDKSTGSSVSIFPPDSPKRSLDDRYRDLANAIRVKACFERLFPKDLRHKVQVVFQRDWTIFDGENQREETFRTTWTSGYFIRHCVDAGLLFRRDSAMSKLWKAPDPLRWADLQEEGSPGEILLFEDLDDPQLHEVTYSQRVNAFDIMPAQAGNLPSAGPGDNFWPTMMVASEELGLSRGPGVGRGVEVTLPAADPFANVVVVGFVGCIADTARPSQLHKPCPAVGFNRRIRSRVPVVDLGFLFDAKASSISLVRGACMKLDTVFGGIGNWWDRESEATFHIFVQPSSRNPGKAVLRIWKDGQAPVDSRQSPVQAWNYEFDDSLLPLPASIQIWVGLTAGQEEEHMDSAWTRVNLRSLEKPPSNLDWRWGSVKTGCTLSAWRALRGLQARLPPWVTQSLRPLHEGPAGVRRMAVWPPQWYPHPQVAEEMPSLVASVGESELWLFSDSGIGLCRCSFVQAKLWSLGILGVRRLSGGGGAPESLDVRPTTTTATAATAGATSTVATGRTGKSSSASRRAPSVENGSRSTTPTRSIASTAAKTRSHFQQKAMGSLAKLNAKDLIEVRLLIGYSGDTEGLLERRILIANPRLPHSSRTLQELTIEVGGQDGARSDEGPWQAHKDIVSGVVVDHAAGLVYTVSYDKTAIQWDLSTGDMLCQAKGLHTKKIYNCALSPGGCWLATAAFDHVAVFGADRERGLTCAAFIDHSWDHTDIDRRWFSVAFFPPSFDPEEYESHDELPSAIIVGDMLGGSWMVPLIDRDGRRREAGGLTAFISAATCGKALFPHQDCVRQLLWLENPSVVRRHSWQQRHSAPIGAGRCWHLFYGLMSLPSRLAAATPSASSTKSSSSSQSSGTSAGGSRRRRCCLSRIAGGLLRRSQSGVSPIISAYRGVKRPLLCSTSSDRTIHVFEYNDLSEAYHTLKSRANVGRTLSAASVSSPYTPFRPHLHMERSTNDLGERTQSPRVESDVSPTTTTRRTPAVVSFFLPTKSNQTLESGQGDNTANLPPRAKSTASHFSRFSRTPEPPRAKSAMDYMASMSFRSSKISRRRLTMRITKSVLLNNPDVIPKALEVSFHTGPIRAAGVDAFGRLYTGCKRIAQWNGLQEYAYGDVVLEPNVVIREAHFPEVVMYFANIFFFAFQILYYSSNHGVFGDESEECESCSKIVSVIALLGRVAVVDVGGPLKDLVDWPLTWTCCALAVAALVLLCPQLLRAFYSAERRTEKDELDLGDRKHYMRVKVWCSLMCFLIFSLMVVPAFGEFAALFRCRRAADGAWKLSADQSIRCWEGVHLFFSIACLVLGSLYLACSLLLETVNFELRSLLESKLAEQASFPASSHFSCGRKVTLRRLLYIMFAHLLPGSRLGLPKVYMGVFTRSSCSLVSRQVRFVSKIVLVMADSSIQNIAYRLLFMIAVALVNLFVIIIFPPLLDSHLMRFLYLLSGSVFAASCCALVAHLGTASIRTPLAAAYVLISFMPILYMLFGFVRQAVEKCQRAGRCGRSSSVTPTLSSLSSLPSSSSLPSLNSSSLSVSSVRSCLCCCLCWPCRLLHKLICCLLCCSSSNNSSRSSNSSKSRNNPHRSCCWRLLCPCSRRSGALGAVTPAPSSCEDELAEGYSSSRTRSPERMVERWDQYDSEHDGLRSSGSKPMGPPTSGVDLDVPD